MVKLWQSIGYISSIFIISASLILILIFGINYGYIKSIIWLSVLMIALIKRHILWDNCFVFIYALKDTFTTRKPPVDVIFEEEIGVWQKLDILKRRADLAMEKLRNRFSSADEFTEEEKQHHERLNIYYNSIVNDFLMFSFYMITLLLIVSGAKSSLAYYSTANVKELVSSHKFGYNIERTQTIHGIYNYIMKNLVENTNRGTDFNGNKIVNDFGWVSNGLGKILGVIRLRQHRIDPSYCQKGALRENCLGTYSSSKMDTKDYSQGWKPKIDIVFQEKYKRIIAPWMYNDGLEGGSMPYVGDMSVYPVGGYMTNLGRNYNNSYIVVNYLKKNKWLDRRTAVLFIEFTLYNADANIFNVVSITLEKSPQGLYKPVVNVLSVKMLFILENQSWLVKVIFIFFLIMTTLFLYRLIVSVWNAKFKKFFSMPWNVVDTIIIIITIITLILFFMRNNYVINLIRELEEKNKNEFISFQFAAIFDSFFVWVSSFLILLATIRLWKILNFAKMFQILSNTLWRATISLIMACILGLILLIGLSICFTIVNGSNIKIFQYFQSSLPSVMVYFIGFGGGINAENVFVGGKFLGVLLFAIGIISIFIIATFMFATTLCYHFSIEKNDVEMPLFSFWSFLKDELKTKCCPDRCLNGYSNKKCSSVKGLKIRQSVAEYNAKKTKMTIEAIDAQMDYLNEYIRELSR